jgi:lipopolysaccharide biosynthesis protein
MPRVIAFYLPQFYPIPENDAFWGKGFTDWFNVARARPQFEGHHQPDLPADLGFYDLRLVDALKEQAVLARQHGVHGFCFHHYWFNGRQVLARPLENLLAHPEIDLPFCLNFANENWTRRWDGGDDEVLIEQKHSDDDDRQFIRSLLPYFRDPRYIRISGKPVLVIYKTGLLPDAAKTARIWREEMANEGLGLYLIRCEVEPPIVTPHAIGYDAAVEFPPHCPAYKPGVDVDSYIEQRDGYAVSRHGELTRLSPDFGGKLLDYRMTARYFCERTLPSYPLHRSVMPGWDNTPRKKSQSSIFAYASPEHYRAWLSYVVRQTAAIRPQEEQLVFVNAWNEWGEGAHLEPCQRYGRAFLEATREAVSGTPPAAGPPEFLPLATVSCRPRLALECADDLSAQAGHETGSPHDDPVARMLAREMRSLAAENRRLGQEIGHLTAELDHVYKSKSWILSEPLRKLNRQLRRADAGSSRG